MTKDFNKDKLIANSELSNKYKQRSSDINLELDKSDQDDEEVKIVRRASVPAFFYKDTNDYFNPDEIAKRKLILKSINEEYSKREKENQNFIKPKTRDKKTKRVTFSSKVQYLDDDEKEGFEKFIKDKLNLMTNIFKKKKVNIIKNITNVDKLSNYYFNDESSNEDDLNETDNCKPLKLKSILKSRKSIELN